MVPVVDQVIVEDAVGAQGTELRGAVDHDAAVSGRDAAVRLLERGWATLGEPVQVPGQAVLHTGLGEASRSLQQTAQAKMGLGESGLPADQRAISGHGVLQVGL